MTPDLLRKIEDLYHAAREASAEERLALLERARPELRREVESLLARQGTRLIPDSAVGSSGAGQLSRAGTLAGPYQVEDKLGEGGMGEVFRAVDTRLGRLVAIKFLHQDFSGIFEHEARAISSLNHPNICTLYDIGADYLVMEFLEGDSLAARLRKGHLPVEQALHYATQIADALSAAHARGIVHRDLKPANIMLTATGVKVLDFGLAIREGDQSFTVGHMVAGTPAYMAPEQREGRSADARADLYSFGCVLYEMLTGERVTSERKPVSPRKLQKIVNRCVAADPGERWQSAADMRGALEAACKNERNSNRTGAAVALVALLAFLIPAWLYFRPAAKLTDKDTIVLADFVNQTGDPIFDGTLRQELEIQLEQSPFLRVMERQQILSALRRMNLPPGARVTDAVAREICAPEKATAIIGGAIARQGNEYFITLRAINCRNGATLAREQIQFETRAGVLKALGSAAISLRGKLGEPRDSIRRMNLALEEATTSSLEALQNYTVALSTMAQGNFLPAVPLFERAVAIDPTFAMAYYYLGVGFEQAGDMARARDYAIKAFRLIDRVSTYERDQIAPYYYLATGEADKAIEAYQTGIRDYPRWWGDHNNLATLYIDLGRFEDALKEGLEASRLQLEAEPPYRRQLDAYICLDRLPEAGQLAQKMRAQGIAGALIHQRFLEMAYIEDDQAAISQELHWFAGKPEEYISIGLQAADRNVHGQRRESRKLFQRAAEAALRRGLLGTASELDEADARADALVGNCQTVRRLGRPAIALAMCGDAAAANRLSAETSKILPNGTIWNAVQLPAIRAAIALNRNHQAESVQLLRTAAPWERAYLEIIYLRGLAWLRLNKGAEAVEEFRKITDHKGASWASAWRYPRWGEYYSLSWLGMARGAALAGDVVNARKAFQQFFRLWKDADPDIPVLQQAKAEDARLR